MDAIVIFAGLAFAVNKTVTVVKALTNRDLTTTLTQLIVWIVGFVGLVLAAHASVTSAYALPGFTKPLGTLDWASLALLAWILGSTGSFAYDIKKAIDGTDTASEARLATKPAAPAA